MDSAYPYDPSLPASSQLIEVQGDLSEAAELFVRPDASGRTPIVISPKPESRLFNWMVIAAPIVVAVGLLIGPQSSNATVVITVAVIVGLGLLGVGLLTAFTVMVPEGVYAMIVRRGKYRRTVQAGSHRLAPWFTVSHIVSSRVIPYNVFVRDAPTADGVRAEVYTTITIQVVDPYKFVYSVSTSAFDMVLQAACQDSLRSMVRTLESVEVYDLQSSATELVRKSIDENIAHYGVSLQSMNIAAARLPSAFMASQESRTLAIIQQLEQAEQQALAIRRQTDAESLARQEVIARIERERVTLQLMSQQAEARRVVTEMDADTELILLRRLDEAAKLYPHAIELKTLQAQLEVAKALAANSRTIVHAGSSLDLVTAMNSAVNSAVLFQELNSQPGPGAAQTQEASEAIPEAAHQMTS